MQRSFSISLAETMGFADAAVWTATEIDGTAASQSDHCMDWTSLQGMGDSVFGYAPDSGSSWTAADLIGCDVQFRLYCFEQ